MLAYVFWHRPAGEPGPYEVGLRDLHAAFAADPPPGFRGSATFARTELPWFDGYEDWYLVDDWAALGTLNRVAPLVGAHDPVAALSDDGTGAVYLLTGGTPDLHAVRAAAWSSEPREGEVTWRRQMVLGPAPQYCAHHSGEIALQGGPGAFERRVRAV